MTANRAASPTARRLVEIALDLIEQGSGLGDVNLREVARRAKCSHANLYNYFDGLDDLLWAALDLAIQRLVTYTENAMLTRARPAEVFGVFIDSQMEFALSNPGLYRFIWLEALAGNPPPAVAGRIEKTPQLFASTLRKTMAPVAEPASVARAARIIHGYLHGELCKLVCARLVPGPAPGKAGSRSSPGALARARKAIRSDVLLLAERLLA